MGKFESYSLSWLGPNSINDFIGSLMNQSSDFVGRQYDFAIEIGTRYADVYETFRIFSRKHP